MPYIDKLCEVVLHASGNPLECPSVYYGQIQENDYIRRYEECYAMAHASKRIVPEVAIRFSIVLRTSFCNVNVNIPLDPSYETSGYMYILNIYTHESTIKDKLKNLF